MFCRVLCWSVISDSIKLGRCIDNCSRACALSMKNRTGLQLPFHCEFCKCCPTISLKQSRDTILREVAEAYFIKK